MVVKPSGEGAQLSTDCRWVISNVVGHLLCSKMVGTVCHRWILLLSFQPFGFCGQDVYIVVLKGMIFILQM